MASASFTKLPVLVAVDGVADGTGLDADMMAGAAAVHGSLMRLVVEHHGLHAGFGSAHGALGIVDGQQHGASADRRIRRGNRVHLLELGLGLFGMATGAGGGAGHNRGLNGGGFGGGLGLHFLGGKLLRALGLGGLLGFHLSGQIRTRGLGHVFMAPHALGVHGGLERRRGTNGLSPWQAAQASSCPFFHTSLFSFSSYTWWQTPQFSSELAGLTIALELTCR